MSKIVCPTCVGHGVLLIVHAKYTDDIPTDCRPIQGMLDCMQCSGNGFITEIQQIWMRSGEKLKRRRLDIMMGLREFAEYANLVPSRVAAMEHGRVDPFDLEKWWDDYDSENRSNG